MVTPPVTGPAPDGWPFAQPVNEAAVTVWPILRREKPILFVCHDADGWQFLTGETFSMSEAAVVALRTVFKIDESVGELADLPEGWQAMRTAPGQPWARHRLADNSSAG